MVTYRKREIWMKKFFLWYFVLCTLKGAVFFVLEAADSQLGLQLLPRRAYVLDELITYGWNLLCLVVTFNTSYCLIKSYHHFEYIKSRKAMIFVFFVSLVLLTMHSAMAFTLSLKDKPSSREVVLVLMRLAVCLNVLCLPQFALAHCLVFVKDSRDLIEGISKLDELLVVSVFQKQTYVAKDSSSVRTEEPARLRLSNKMTIDQLVKDNTFDRSHLMAFYNESAFDREECHEMWDIDAEQGSSNSEQRTVAQGSRSSAMNRTLTKRAPRLTMHNSFDPGLGWTRYKCQRSYYYGHRHETMLMASSNNISEEPESHRISKASSTLLNERVLQAQRLDLDNESASYSINN